MREKLSAYFESGDPEKLHEIHELLWAYERGQLVELPTEASVDLKLDLDWEALEQLALRETPRERLAALVQRTPNWVWVLPVLLSPIVILLVLLWAWHTLPGGSLGDRIIVAMVALVVTTLSALALSLAAQAAALRGGRETEGGVSRWAFAASVLIVVAVGGIALGVLHKQASPAVRLTDDAWRSLLREDYQSAANEYAKAARLSPEDHEIRLSLGYAQLEASSGGEQASEMRTHGLSRAAYNLRQVAEVSADDDRVRVRALEALGRLSARQGDYAKAREWYGKALALEPERFDLRRQLALVDWAEVRAELRRPDLSAAEKKLLSTRLDAASARLQTKRQLSPGQQSQVFDTQARLYLTKARLVPSLEQRRLERQAIDLLLKAAELPPDDDLGMAVESAG